MAFIPENIMWVNDYFPADSKRSICNVSYDLGSKVVIDPLDVFGSDCHVSVFLSLASFGHASSFFKALDDAVKGICMCIVLVVARHSLC